MKYLKKYENYNIKSTTGNNVLAYFETGQGSKYLITDKGETKRWKSEHSNTGAEDIGLKNWYQKSFFVEPKFQYEANSIQFLIDKGFKTAIDIKNNEAIIYILKDNKWVIGNMKDAYPKSNIDRELKFNFVNKPTINYNVVELNLNQDNFSIKNYHFGSEVTKIIDADKITDEEIKYFKKTYEDFSVFDTIQSEVHIKTYEDFSFELIFESILPEDMDNYILIFNSIYENHLNLNEQILIKNNYYLITESWFSDLVDKSKRGVLNMVNDAGALLIEIAKKAKDVLDFAKMLANKIFEHVKSQFNDLLNKVKKYALKDSVFIAPLLEFIQKKKTQKLKFYIKYIGELITYILKGKMFVDLFNKLIDLFKNVLNRGTNEGLYYLEHEFLLEDVEENEEDAEKKKSFIVRLADKIKSFPPFSWLPKIDELLKKGVSYISKIIDKFFAWLQGRDSDMSSFSKAFYFLFQILELYIHYKLLGSIERFKEFLNKASGLEELTAQIKDQTLDEIWDKIGISGEEIRNKIISIAKKIPCIGTILSVLDSLVVALGAYLAVEPEIKRIIT